MLFKIQAIAWVSWAALTALAVQGCGQCWGGPGYLGAGIAAGVALAIGQTTFWLLARAARKSATAAINAQMAMFVVWMLAFLAGYMVSMSVKEISMEGYSYSFIALFFLFIGFEVWYGKVMFDELKQAKRGDTTSD